MKSLNWIIVGLKTGTAPDQWSGTTSPMSSSSSLIVTSGAPSSPLLACASVATGAGGGCMPSMTESSMSLSSESSLPSSFMALLLSGGECSPVGFGESPAPSSRTGSSLGAAGVVAVVFPVAATDTRSGSILTSGLGAIMAVASVAMFSREGPTCDRPILGLTSRKQTVGCGLGQLRGEVRGPEGRR